MMPKKQFSNRRAFTLIEMMIAMLVAGIMCLTVGIAMVNNQRGWNATFGKSYADIVHDGYVARKTFDRVIRQASNQTFLLGEAGTYIEVYYYASDDSSSIDRYARFYTAGGELMLEDGILDPKETLTIQTVCGNVSGCVFKKLGSSAQMILELDDGTQRSTVISSAVLHNE